MARSREKKELVEFPASEGFYAFANFLLALLGGITILSFLSFDSVFIASAPFIAFVGLLATWMRKAEAKRTDDDESFLVSFSRSKSLILSDILVELVKLSFFAVLFDAVSKGVSFQKLFDPAVQLPQNWHLWRLGMVLVGSMLAVTYILYAYSTVSKLEIVRRKNAK